MGHRYTKVSFGQSRSVLTLPTPKGALLATKLRKSQSGQCQKDSLFNRDFSFRLLVKTWVALTIVSALLVEVEAGQGLGGKAECQAKSS